jgi:hypothetical protein
MRLVDSPVMAPGHCAAIPFLGQTSPNQRWIDTGTTLEGWNDRVYLSETAVRQMWELLRFPSPQAYEAMVERVEKAEALVVDLDERLVAAEARLAAVDILESADFTARKKAGRPRVAA